jgi:hypothetical protein
MASLVTGKVISQDTYLNTLRSKSSESTLNTVNGDETVEGSFKKFTTDKVTDLKNYSDTTFPRLDKNLEDLPDKQKARENLTVYSTEEVETLVNTAITNFAKGVGSWKGTVDTVTDLNNLTTDTIVNGDTVKVVDNGDEHWAIYKALVDDQSNIIWEKVYDENDSLGFSASEVKALYEGNPDTNSFTDVDKNKLSNVTVTSPINLDKVVESDGLATELTGEGSETVIPSTSLIYKYMPKFMPQDTFTVQSDYKIELAYRPMGDDLPLGTIQLAIDGKIVVVTCQKDTNDSTGKTYIIDNGSDITGLEEGTTKGQVSYLFTIAEQG